MNISQKTRVTKLEEKQSKSDQVKEYCPCTYHQTYLQINEEKAGRVIDILRSLKVRHPDGTESDGYEMLLERINNKKECNCAH